MKILVFVFILFATGFCCSILQAAAPPIITDPIVHYDGMPLVIGKWIVVGPYTGDNADDLWNRNLLSSVARAESEISYAALLRYSIDLTRPSSISSSEGIVPKMISDSDFIDLINLYGKPHADGAPPYAAYAACQIKSATLEHVYLLLGSSDGVNVWLNGRPIKEGPSRHGVETYNEAIPIDLQAGNNFLLIKVVRWSHIAWGLTARIEPSREEAAETALRMQDMIEGLLFRKSVLSNPGDLILAPRGTPEGMRFKVSITRPDGSFVDDVILGGKGDKWTPSLSVGQGIYQAKVHSKEHVYVQPFCLGSPAKIADSLNIRAERYAHTDERIAINIQTLQRRLSAILKAEDGQERGNWERKITYTLEETDKVLNLLDHGKEAFKGVPGLHLRGFRSAIDDQVQHYRLFVPSSYIPNTQALPIIVMLPTIGSASRPFIESAFLTAQAEADHLSMLAERYKFGILWCGYRTQPTGEPCEFAHINEALEAIARDYEIDSHRIYLLGACSGGAVATMLAARWPERFAAIALLNPVFDLAKHQSPQQRDFIRFAGYRSWLGETNTLSAFFKIKGLPTYVIHDGAEPGHGDLKVSVAFAARAQDANYPLRFEQTDQTLTQHFGAWESLFSWLASQRRVNPSPLPAQEFLATQDHLGPIANVFANRFVVVEGTAGTEADRAAIKNISDKFLKNWVEMHYGPCRIVTDRTFDDEKESASSLILLGNSETNLIWKKYSSRLPIVITQDQVAVGVHKWQGHNLSFEAVFPKPGRADRQIVLIGGDKIDQASIGLLNISVEGWFDYAIWDKAEEETRLIDAGLW